jgi:membrane protease YdiL (CAAX protease family)
MTVRETFLELARRGRNDWWRYLVSLPLIIVGWFAVALVLYILLLSYAVADGDPATAIDLNRGEVTGAPLLTLVVLLLGFAGLHASLFAAVRFVHRRPLLSLITPYRRLSWGRVAAGFVVFLVLAAAAVAVEAALFPGRYRLTFDAGAFLKFLPFALVLVPLQTSAEELFFRGYLMQAVGLLTRRAFVPALASALLFALLHLANPEIGAGLAALVATYFVLGLVFALVTIRDDRLELALGAHAANNLFAALFANYAGSALSTPAVFTAATLDSTYTLMSSVAVAALFYALLFARRGARPAEASLHEPESPA